jgi:hypothetical protein
MTTRSSTSKNLLVFGSTVAALQLRRPQTCSFPSPTTPAGERLRLTGEGSEQRVNGILVRFGCLLPIGDFLLSQQAVPAPVFVSV